MENPDPTSQFAFKSHETALCLIPPRHLWSSVDQLRSLYDKAFSAWPPHINLVYPFVRPEVLPEVTNLLQDLSIEHQPHITLQGADTFNHKHHNTIFFRPSQGSIADITQLRRRICDVLGQPRTNHGSFKPHMTIGQSEDSNAAPHHFLVEKVRLLPQLVWDVDSIAILVRDAAASSSNGSRPMKLWGTLDLSSRLLTRPTSPQDFRDPSEFTSDIIFQPPYHSPQASGPWAVLSPSVPIANDEELTLDRLVIASYNVLAEFEWPPQSVRHSGLVKNLLSTHSAADILVLQEVTDHFLPVLLADQEIRRRYPFVTHGPPGQLVIGPLPSLLNVVVLSRFPLEWHHLPFQRRHKGCTVVRFPTIGIRDRDGCFRPWILAACHLSQGLTDGAITAKKREVQRMLDHLSAHFPQHPWILAGDFNLATSSFTIDAAKKKQDISSQTVDHLQSIDRMLLDAGFTDTWLATRLESGESSDVVNDKRNVLDSFQGEQGATFDPLTNTLASELVGNGLNNRPQRYDRILVRVDDQYHPLGFNMFGQAPLQPTQQGGPTYASDHWGIRCLLLHSPSTEISRSSVPAMTVQLQRAPATLADNEVLEHFLERQGFLPTAHERATRAEALKALEHALLDATPSVSQGGARSGPILILVPVGSYGLGVWTSSSDIDCLCIGSISPKVFFALAVQRLRRAVTGGIRILRRVKANSGNMLELEVHGIKIDLQYCAAASIAERWPEVMKRPASDPAFALPFQTLAKLKPVRDLFYLRRSIPDMVQYRMAHLFIKTWAQSRGIYSAKFGFLGGIHISVLLAPLCKMLANDGATVSTADIIVTFFQHYARFGWKTALVFDPFFHKDLRYNRTFREPLCLLGWHAPALNTAVNASVPTVDVIAAEFERAERLLSVESFSWSNLLGIEPDNPPSSLSGPGATEFLQNYKSYIKIDAHYWGPSQEKSGRFIGWLESRCVMLLVDLDRKVKNIHARIWPARFLDMASSEEGPGTEYHGHYLIGLSRNGEEPNKDDAKATQVALQAALQEFEARIRRDEKYYDAQFCWMSAAVVRTPELGNLELDKSRWGEFAGDTDDEDEDDEMEEEENDSDGESQSTAKKNVASSHGSRAAVVSKTPGLGKFRTAADVLNRLRWDAGFDANDFIVGYEDRFLGPRERPVEQWKSEQTDEEFIPQHRILYFKRKSDGVIVWERRSRIDDIFGSGIKTDG